ARPRPSRATSPSARSRRIRPGRSRRTTGFPAGCLRTTIPTWNRCGLKPPTISPGNSLANRRISPNDSSGATAPSCSVTRCRPAGPSPPNRPELADRLPRRLTMQMNDMILVSVDDHIIEPANLFERHVSAKYKDQAPRVVTFRGGEQRWKFQDRLIPTIASCAVSGRKREELGAEASNYEDMRSGC